MTDERIVFMGTPDFAVATLEALVDEGANIVGVITAPDRRSGRGMKFKPSAVKQFAMRHGLNVLQPSNLKSEVFLTELKELKATLQVVVAFRMLPEVVWDMPPKGTINLHASLLPQYRGAAPINWAIINGEKETGVTTFFIRQKIDTGDIIYQERVAIGENETVGELHDRLMMVGAQLTVKTVTAILEGKNPSSPQDVSETELKIAPKIFKEDCRIDWNEPARKVFDLIRGLSPNPAAFTLINEGTHETSLKIYEADLVEKQKSDAPPGSIESEHGQMFIKCYDGWLRVSKLQLAGKKRMSAEDFLLGFDVSGYTAV